MFGSLRLAEDPMVLELPPFRHWVRSLIPQTVAIRVEDDPTYLKCSGFAGNGRFFGSSDFLPRMISVQLQRHIYWSQSTWKILCEAKNGNQNERNIFVKVIVGKRAYVDSSWVVLRTLFRSSLPEVLLGKGVLKICSKFTGEHPCRSVISIKLLSPVNLLHIFKTHPANKLRNNYVLYRHFSVTNKRN